MKVIEASKVRSNTISEKEKAIIKFNHLAMLLHGKKSIEPDPTTWLLIKEDVLSSGYTLEEEYTFKASKKIKEVKLYLPCS